MIVFEMTIGSITTRVDDCDGDAAVAAVTERFDDDDDGVSCNASSVRRRRRLAALISCGRVRSHSDVWGTQIQLVN